MSCHVILIFYCQAYKIKKILKRPVGCVALDVAYELNQGEILYFIISKRKLFFISILSLYFHRSKQGRMFSSVKVKSEICFALQ